MKPSLALPLSVFAGWVQADWQFRSRPDLSPPRLNITIPASDDVSPGYVFVAPYPAGGIGPEQQAAYIFRNDGDLIWSSLGYFAGWIGNLQVSRYKGQTVLQAFQGTVDSTHGRGWGSPLLFDQSYKPVAQVQGLTSKLMSIHELTIVSEKSVLVEIYQPRPFDLTPYGGTKEQQWIVDGIFQEIDIETGELLFESRSLDYSPPNDSALPLRSGDTLAGLSSKDAWDYFHLNSVDKDDRGDYLVSSRHTHTIFKISGRDGHVIWRFGGQKPSFSHGEDLDFGYQHDARFLSRSEDGQVEVISFLDNSATTGPDGVEHIHPHSHSRGLIVTLNHTDNTATAVQAFNPPDNLSAASQGNAQVLGDGNVFVNWGQQGAVTEFTPGGTPIFHAYLDSDSRVQNYRGFRHEWNGHPREIPAVVALRSNGSGSGSSGDATTIYVSWNGDTEVDTWRFYAQASSPSRGQGRRTSGHGAKKLGEVERTSFETSLTVSQDELRSLGRRPQIFAEGLGKDGNVLATTSEVSVQEAVEPVSGQEVLFGDGEL